MWSSAHFHTLKCLLFMKMTKAKMFSATPMTTNRNCTHTWANESYLFAAHECQLTAKSCTPVHYIFKWDEKKITAHNLINFTHMKNNTRWTAREKKRKKLSASSSVSQKQIQRMAICSVYVEFLLLIFFAPLENAVAHKQPQSSYHLLNAK